MLSEDRIGETMLYREFKTQEEIDNEYNPRVIVADVPGLFVQMAVEAARVRDRLNPHQRVAYGPTLAEYVDVFPAARAGAPVHVFIHGGYWRALSAADFHHVAEGLHEAGHAVVLVNYALCPAVTLGEIVRQCRAALAWVGSNAASFGGDAGRISVSGHSAGGHLTGMLLATDWAGQYGLPADLIKLACPISGLFDLAPFPYSWLQPSLQLDWAEVRRSSPMFLAPTSRPKIVVAVGGLESAEFHRQSLDYVAMLRADGHEPAYLDLAGRNHFTVTDELAAGGALHQAIVQGMTKP